MEIKAQIEQLVQKLTSDQDSMAQFQKNPVAAVEKLLGVDLPDDTAQKIVQGVKAKLNLDQAKGALGAIKKLF